jgi:DNA-binding NtrC family response regulator
LSEREQRLTLLGAGPPELTTTRRSCLEKRSTVVLQHIDQAGVFLQEQLARILQTKKVIRLGSGTTQLAFGRIICTFRRPLHLLVGGDSLIRSLYSRLRTYEQITVPPLRNRQEDLSLLVSHFLNQALQNCGLPERERIRIDGFVGSKGRIDAGLLKSLQQQRWNENVAQLKAYARNILTLSPQLFSQEQELLEVTKAILMVEEGTEVSLERSLSTIEQAIIHRALARTAGQESTTARLLGISNRSFRRKVILA